MHIKGHAHGKFRGQGYEALEDIKGYWKDSTGQRALKPRNQSNKIQLINKNLKRLGDFSHGELSGMER